jgi:Zn-dependent metalloprotease
MYTRDLHREYGRLVAGTRFANMKNFVRFLFALIASVASSFLVPHAGAMPSLSRPTTSTGAAVSPPPKPSSTVQWLNPVNQGTAAWISQQVQARQAANMQKQMAQRYLQPKSQFLASSAITGLQINATFRPNGTPLEIKGNSLQAAFIGPNLPGSDHHLETALSFLRANSKVLLLEDPDSELVLRTRQTDELGWNHLRFRQEYKGLAVWPAELSVHISPSGSVELLDGAFVPSPRVQTTPSILALDAVEKAKQRLQAKQATPLAAPELIIYGPLDRPSRLAWKFDLVAGIAQAWTCVVDARDASLLAHFSLVTEGAVAGSGVDGLGTNRTLHLWQQGANFYLEDTSKQMYDPASMPPDPNNMQGAIFIWDSQNTPPTNSPTSTANFLGNPVLSVSASASSGWVPDAVGAAFGLGQTYDYYLARHSRNSLDGAGGSINGFVRVGINWRNAFWTQAYKVMVFGDTLPDGLDVCAHELTHGVIFSIGDGGILNYHDQPGAMNEALADIFGENVEAFTKGTGSSARTLFWELFETWPTLAA